VAFEPLLRVAQKAYPIREDNVIFTDNIPSGLLRRWVVEVGRRLAERGLISRAADAVYLEADELLDALDGSPAQDCVERIVRRRSEMAWTKAHPGPAHVGEPDEMPDISKLPSAMRRTSSSLLWLAAQEYPADSPEKPGESIVSGSPASPGRVTGPARIVLGESDFHKVRPGDIMVSPITTPAWTMLFSTASGVVTDGGGVLSHAAIVAREHGIPAVIGAPGATTRIADGQLIAIDGATGDVSAVD
jgi:pyruvate,water dikinase